jgi:hypothetical protein
VHPAKTQLPDARQEGDQSAKRYAQPQPYVLGFQCKPLVRFSDLLSVLYLDRVSESLTQSTIDS